MNLGPSSHLGEQLHRLLDDELSAVEAARVRAHLKECAECSGLHAQLERTLGVLHSMGRARAPVGFTAKLMRRVRFTQRRSRRSTGPFSVPIEGAVVLLLAAALSLLVGWMAGAP